MSKAEEPALPTSKPSGSALPSDAHNSQPRPPSGRPLLPPNPVSGQAANTDGNNGITGRRLGQYTILEKIGQGGMGSVFKAFDTALERTVALKVLFCSALDNPKHAERFVREARSLARLNHPNLVHVYNVGMDNDCYYFAMELMEGESLAQMVRRRRRVPAAEALPILGQIVSALHYIHRQGVTHRDVKSGNIMVAGRRAVLMDFGLAKDDHFSGLTSDGSVLGTPDYMAPEQAEGIVAGPPTDLYSLGVVMYEMLSGAVPFVGKSALTIIRQHLEVPPPPIEAALPNIDPMLASCVHKCLAKKALDRYPNCGALAADLIKLHNTPELAALVEETASEEPRTVPRGSGLPTATLPFGTQPTAIEARPFSEITRNPGEQDATLTLGTAPVRVNQSSVLTVPETDAALSAANAAANTGAPVEHHGTPRPWLWVALGFFGVILLAIFLAKRHEAEQASKRPDANGTPARVHRPGAKTEDIRLIEFRTGGTDPSQWMLVFERQTSDGKWVRESANYKDAERDSVLLEFLAQNPGVVPDRTNPQGPAPK